MYRPVWMKMKSEQHTRDCSPVGVETAIPTSPTKQRVDIPQLSRIKVRYDYSDQQERRVAPHARSSQHVPEPTHEGTAQQVLDASQEPRIPPPPRPAGLGISWSDTQKPLPPLLEPSFHIGLARRERTRRRTAPSYFKARLPPPLAPKVV
jgi:hypothetical protein